MSKRSTFEEKAKLFIDQLVEQDGLDVGAVMHRKIEQRVKLLLKEQDRDTRHGCAELVQESKMMNDYADQDIKLIDVNDAHNACMNYQQS